MNRLAATSLLVASGAALLCSVAPTPAPAPTAPSTQLATRPWLRVTAFGAIPNDGLDDRAAIQAAIDSAAHEGGGTVMFPPGTYHTQGKLSVSTAGIRLLGGPAVVQARRRQQPAIEVTAGDFVAERLTLRGPGVSVVTANEHGIHAHGPSGNQRITGVEVRSCDISDFGYAGVLCKWVDGARLHDNELHDLAYAGAMFQGCSQGVVAHNRVITIGPGSQGNMYGISLTHDYPFKPSTGFVDRFLVSGNEVEDIAWTGIDGHAPSNVRVIGNHVRSCRNPINVSASSAAAASYTGENIVIEGNVVEGGTRPNQTANGGINVGGSSAMLQRRVTIVGNVVEGQGLTGNAFSGAIRAYEIDGLVIANNTVTGFGGHGLYLSGTIRAATISGNAFGDGVDPNQGVIRDDSVPASTRTYTGNRSSYASVRPLIGLRISQRPTTGHVLANGNRFDAATEFVNVSYIAAKWP